MEWSQRCMKQGRKNALYMFRELLLLFKFRSSYNEIVVKEFFVYHLNVVCRVQVEKTFVCTILMRTT